MQSLKGTAKYAPWNTTMGVEIWETTLEDKLNGFSWGIMLAEACSISIEAHRLSASSATHESWRNRATSYAPLGCPTNCLAAAAIRTSQGRRTWKVTDLISAALAELWILRQTTNSGGDYT